MPSRKVLKKLILMATIISDAVVEINPIEAFYDPLDNKAIKTPDPAFQQLRVLPPCDLDYPMPHKSKLSPLLQYILKAVAKIKAKKASIKCETCLPCLVKKIDWRIDLTHCDDQTI